jgi:cytochrome c553
MKFASLQLALAVIVAVVFSGVGLADGTRTRRAVHETWHHHHYYAYRHYRRQPAGEAPAGRGTLQAKIQYCSDCHGMSGQGYRGYYPMPRLAGQTTEYFENSLRTFVERAREIHVAITMSKTHGGLSPEMRAALAAHFKDLNPRPYGNAPRGPVDAGKKIFEEGVPDANVPACSACHGPDAKGNAAIPRLAGQLYPYTVKELANWSTERGQNLRSPDTSAIMQPIAHSLNKSQIEAVSAYLAYQE